MSFVLLDLSSSVETVRDMRDGFFSIDELEALYEKTMVDVSEISAYVMSICAIGALLYICFKVFGPWTRGESIDFYSLLRPFVIGLVIMNFSMVPGFIDMCVKPVESYTGSLKEKGMEEYLTKTESLGKAFENYYKRVFTENSESGDGIFIKIYNVLKRLDVLSLANMAAKIAAMNAVLGVSMFLCELIVVALMVFMIVTKIVLVLLGPLVFTLAVFPKFEHGIVQWLCRYINVSLWIPIANIIGYVMQQLFVCVVYDSLISSLNSDASLASANAGAGDFGYMLMFLILSCILYCMVPRIAGWVIDGNGAGMIGEAVGGTVKSAGGAAMGATGAKVAVTKVSGV